MTCLPRGTFTRALSLLFCIATIGCGSSDEKAKSAPSGAHGTTTDGAGGATGAGWRADGGATTTPLGTGGAGAGGAGTGGTGAGAGGAGTGGAGAGGAGTGAGGAGTGGTGAGAGGTGTGGAGTGAGGTGTGGAGATDAGLPDAGVACLSPIFADSPPLSGATIASAAEDHASSSYVITHAGITRYDAAGTVVWVKKFDANAVAHRVLVDGNNDPIVIGVFSGTAVFGATTLTSAGMKDVFVVKLAPNGNAQWATAGGGGGDDDANDLAIDAANDIVVAGSFSGAGAAFGQAQLASLGGRDVYVAKLDTNGALGWARSFGGTGDDYTFGLGGDDAGALVGGMFSTSPSVAIGATTLMAGQHHEAIVYRLDADGTPAWAKSAGGDADAWVSGIGMDSAGSAYVAGMFGGTAVFDFDHGVTLQSAGGTEAFLAKYDASGGVEWARRVGHGVLDFGLQNDSAGDTISVDPQGSASVVGWFSGTATFGPSIGGVSAESAGGTDLFIARFDAAGELVCLVPGGGPLDDMATGVAADGIGGVVASGYFDTTATVAGLPLAGAGGPSVFAVKLTQ